MVARETPHAPSVVLAVVIVLIVSTALSIAVARYDPGHSAPSSPAAGASVSPFGAAQLGAAQQSLLHEEGPAADAGPTFSFGAYGWTNLTSLVGTHPSSRYIPAMTWDGHDGYVLLFGGTRYNASSIHFLADTWTYLNGTWTNITSTVVGSPPTLGGAGMAYDPAEGSVILFGGDQNDSFAYNETYSYSHGVWTNITTLVHAAPSPRIVPGMVWDSTDNEIVLTGGLDAADLPLPGTWVFQGDVWSNITTTAPIPAVLFTPNLADDPADHGVLASSIMSYTGTGRGPYFSGTFLFTGGTWQNLTGSLGSEPPLVYVGAMTWVSPAVGDLLVTGLLVNLTGTYEPGQVVWQFHSDAWTNVSSTVGIGPIVSAAAGIAVDPDDQSIIVLGGADAFNDHSVDQVWAMSASPLANATANVSVTDVGIPVAFQGSSSRGLAPVSLAWSFGDGQGSSAASVDHTFTKAGVFTVNLTVTDALGRVGTSSISVTVNADPTVAITVSPTNPAAGGAATLVATVTGGTAPYQYSWDLGDGTSAHSAIVTHNYSRAQSYSVSLTVTDHVGKATSGTTSVTVTSTGTSPSNGSQGSGSGSSVDLFSGVGLLLLVGLVVVAAVAVVLGVLLMRRPRTPSPPPSVYLPPPPP